MNTTIGLDIAASEIHLVQIAHKSLPIIKIHRWGSESFSSEAIVDGKIKEPSRVTAALKRLMHALGIKNGEAAIAVPYHGVISKRFKLPTYLTEEECEAEIAAHLSQYLPDSREKLCFDFIDLGNDDNDSRELIVFATRQLQLASYVNCVQEAGLMVQCVDIDGYALMRALKWCLLQCTGYAAVLHCNHSPQLILVHNNEVLFMQNILKNDLNLSQEIKSILKMRSIQIDKITQMILIGNAPDIADELTKELRVPLIKFELSDKFCELSSNYLCSFGLALRRGAHV